MHYKLTKSRCLLYVLSYILYVSKLLTVYSLATCKCSTHCYWQYPSNVFWKQPGNLVSDGKNCTKPPLPTLLQLLFKGTLKLFPDPCTNLNPRQQRFPSLHNFSMRAILSFKVTSHQAVPLHVPMNWFIELFFIFLLAIFMPSLEKCLFSSSAHFKSRLFVLLLIWVLVYVLYHVLVSVDCRYIFPTSQAILH